MQRTVAQQPDDMSVQRKPSIAEEATFANAHPGKITEVGDTRGGSSGLGSAESNEFVLWNYHVGRSEPRDEHETQLKPVAERWVGILRQNPSLHVKAVGSASTTGGASVATPLSNARAAALKRFLVSKGIDERRIVVTGVGSRLPLADESTPEGMTRNRRVELFLFRPTAAVDMMTASSVDVLSEEVSLGKFFERRFDLTQNFVALRYQVMTASATVEGFGPSGTEVGYLQFLRGDSRVGRYEPTRGGQGFVLDFSRCTKPYLPCRDVAESTVVFSSPSLPLNPGPVKTNGTVKVADQPGTLFPLTVREPRPARLTQMEWSMEFVCVLGVRSGDQFMSLQHFIWRVDSIHSNASSSTPLRNDKAELLAAGVSGAPPDLDIGRAMALQTCRFTARRIEAGDVDERKAMCRPELA